MSNIRNRLIYDLKNDIGSGSSVFARFEAMINGAVIINAGQANDLKNLGILDADASRPPFPLTLTFLDTPNDSDISKIAIVFKEITDSSQLMHIAGMSREDGSWRAMFASREEFNYLDPNVRLRQDVRAWRDDMCLVFAAMGNAKVSVAEETNGRSRKLSMGDRNLLKSSCFKILTIVVDAMKIDRVDHGGTHASPRTHLRRGHERHLRDGRKIWIRPCQVGNGQGWVEKNYRVATRALVDASKGLS